MSSLGDLLPDIAILIMELFVVDLCWTHGDLELEYTVSPTSTTGSGCILLTWHVTFFVWSLAVLANAVTDPTFTSILHARVFEAPVHCQLEASPWVSITCSQEFGEVPSSCILETAEI
jgi:hypothetical protein